LRKTGDEFRIGQRDPRRGDFAHQVRETRTSARDPDHRPDLPTSIPNGFG
jgi:hypothetical protein